MPGSRLIEVLLRAPDLEAAATFYREVGGLELRASEPHPPLNEPHWEVSWGEWSKGGGDYLAVRLYPARPGRQSGGVELRLLVADLEERHRRARRLGAQVLEPPHEGPWAPTAVYRDPGGHRLQLIEA